MIADFFTKPLQGVAFTGFRDFIMNVASGVANGDIQNHRSVLKNENPDSIVNTIHGYKNDDDGFTIVMRRQRRNKKCTIDWQPTSLSNSENSKRVKKCNANIAS